jgi:hypothetical protein
MLVVVIAVALLIMGVVTFLKAGDEVDDIASLKLMVRSAMLLLVANFLVVFYSIVH